MELLIVTINNVYPYFIVTSGIVGGTSILTLIFAQRHDTRIVLSIFFLAAYAVIYTTTSIILLENYPTAVRWYFVFFYYYYFLNDGNIFILLQRGTMTGLTSVLPYLTSFFIKFVVRITCPKSLYIVSGLLIGMRKHSRFQFLGK